MADSTDYWTPTIRSTRKNEAVFRAYATEMNMGISETWRSPAIELIPGFEDDMPKQGKYDRDKAGLINKNKGNK